MRITAIILLFFCLHVSGKTLGQNVTYTSKNEPLLKVFSAFTKQTGYTFFYRNEDVDPSKLITVTLKDAPLSKALDKIFENLLLQFEIEGKTIVISKRIEQRPVPKEIDAFDISGKIINERGEPVVGASIQVKGSSRGTRSDQKGEFFLTGFNETVILVISGAEIRTVEVRIADSNPVNIVVTSKISELDQVLVVAYGTTTKRLTTGNTASIKAKEIEKQPVNNPLLAMQGRVPGLTITQNTGVAGGGITVRIQGQNSLNRGTDPLYVIDGVPYISQLLPNISTDVGILGPNGNNNSSYAQGGGGNPLSFINPADIESIDILKDADATAIYGSRGANGVILITTKKGKVGKTTMDLNVQNGFGKVTRMLPLLDTRQYLDMRYKAFQNDGINWRASNVSANDLKVWDTTRYTDWQKILIGGTSQFSDAQLSFSGGNATTSFLVGAGYHRETTVFPGDLNDNKITTHFNISHVSSDQRFRLNFTGSYMYDNNNLIKTDFTQLSLTLAPNAPSLYNEDGTLNWAPLSNGRSSWYNPLAYLENKYNIKTNNLLASALVGYQLLPSLEFKTSLGYTFMQQKEIYKTPIMSFSPETRANSSRYSNFSDNLTKSWIVEPQLNYTHSLGNGMLSLLAGTTFSQNNSVGTQLYGYGYSSDLLLEDITSAPTIGAVSSLNSVYKYNAFFGRVNYILDNSYIINITGRRDGSSRFGAENMFNNYWSTAAAWIFSNDSNIKNLFSFLSFGKLRASYGTTGNDQIGDYQFMNLYNSYPVAVAYQGATGITPLGLPNPYLQWEETKKIQVGIDLGFNRDNILLNVNYYRNRSSNLLQGYQLPSTTGFGDIQMNFPATIQNKGWEMMFTSNNIDRSGFKWTTSANITFPDNKLLSFQDLASSSYANQYVIGEPVSIKRVFRLSGVNPNTGIYQFSTKDGGNSATPVNPDDATHLINTDPVYYGGLQNSFSYKGIELTVLLQFSKQIATDYYLGNSPGRFSSTGMTGNQPVYILDAWEQAGDNANIQRYSSSYPSGISLPYTYARLSDRAFSDASFIRCKNLSLSFNLLQYFDRKVKIANARLYVQAQNLFTITNYKGIDPESASVTRMPPLKVVTFGLQLSL